MCGTYGPHEICFREGATSRSNKITFIKQSKQNKIISISNNFIKKKDRTTKITELIDKENKLVIILWTLS